MAKKATVSEVRAWAKQQGFDLGDRGRLPAAVWTAWEGRGKRARATRDEQATGTSRAPQATPTIAVQDFDDAQARIAELERQLAALTERVSGLEQRAAEPRRRFARAR